MILNESKLTLKNKTSLRYNSSFKHKLSKKFWSRCVALCMALAVEQAWAVPAITFNGDPLSVTESGGIFTCSTQVALSGDSAVIYTAGNNLAFTGSFSSNGPYSLTFIGGGTVDFSGAQGLASGSTAFSILFDAYTTLKSNTALPLWSPSYPVFGVASGITYSEQSQISGVGPLVIDGQGTFKLNNSSTSGSAANNWTNGTIVRDGILQIDNAGQLPSSSNVYLNTTYTTNAGTAHPTVKAGGALTNLNLMLNDDKGSVGTAGIIDTNGNDVTLGTNSAIDSGYTLTKVGTGDLTAPQTLTAFGGSVVIKGGAFKMDTNGGTFTSQLKLVSGGLKVTASSTHSSGGIVLGGS